MLYRLWTATSPWFMRGLETVDRSDSSELVSTPSSLNDFLETYFFRTTTDEQDNNKREESEV